MLSLARFKDAISGKPQLAVTAEEPERRGATPLASLFPDRLPTLREAEDRLSFAISESAAPSKGSPTPPPSVRRDTQVAAVRAL
jgi:hypothetical protein